MRASGVGRDRLRHALRRAAACCHPARFCISSISSNLESFSGSISDGSDLPSAGCIADKHRSVSAPRPEMDFTRKRTTAAYLAPMLVFALLPDIVLYWKHVAGWVTK